MMVTYMGRTIASLLHCDERSSAWLSRPERWYEESPAQILDALSVVPGMKIADVGAGTGFFTVPLAQRAGRRGFVVATDLQPEMLNNLLSRRDLPPNVFTALSTPNNAGLPENTFDLILMVDAYHESPRPDLMLRDLRRALKRNGRLALVEYRREDWRTPMHPSHKMTARQMIRELHANRFRLVQRFDHLPWQHLLVFEKA